jgi:hypothetical protein
LRAFATQALREDEKMADGLNRKCNQSGMPFNV